jgi:predicted RNA binding protein YcfA (HicA-like mRNA interferase family)
VKIPRELKKIQKRAEAQGWTVHRTRGSHVVWIAPDRQKVYCSSTPSDHRGWKNHVARMRRAGYREQ